MNTKKHIPLGTINPASDREVRFCFEYIMNKMQLTNTSNNGDDFTLKPKIIKEIDLNSMFQFICEFLGYQDDPKKYCEHLKEMMKLQFLEESYFKWLKDDNKACYYMWIRNPYIFARKVYPHSNRSYN